MNVTCSQCGAVYRVDPRKVPPGGVLARCSHCSGTFRVEAEREEPRSAESAAGSTVVREEAGATPAAGEVPARPEEAEEVAPEGADEEEREQEQEPEPLPAPQPSEGARQVEEVRSPSPFGSADPHARARRLARALVSDIVVYHPERRERARQTGTLRQEFREEIKKSWEEYIGQVGAEFGRQTPYFRDALNEILAGGERVF